MSKRRKFMDVERWFDGESSESNQTEDVLTDAGSKQYAKDLETMREGVKDVMARERIEDGQFPAFMEGIRERIDPPARGHRGIWAFASAAAAALIVALSVYMVFTPPSPHTVVEACSTEVEGATATSYYSDNGTAVVWVERDVL